MTSQSDDGYLCTLFGANHPVREPVYMYQNQKQLQDVMPTDNPVNSIMRTKLYRPPMAQDVVCRKSLHKRLDAGLDLPLTLVSAPAGYGKSTLISHWLECSDVKSAWVSLESADGNLRTFLQYLATAVNNVFPRSCKELSRYLMSHDLPPTSTLITVLSYELEKIKQKFVLVFDDYHNIPVRSLVHEIVGALLVNLECSPKTGPDFMRG